MNYRLRTSYSVVLMSRRSNAPYADRILKDGETIEYEGHDAPRRDRAADPKSLDQPRLLPTGRFTQNGLFAEAIEAYQRNERDPELVRVYEKLFNGVWSDKGLFELIDYKFVQSGPRKVFKFHLRATEDSQPPLPTEAEIVHRRLIPSEVKKEVWKRDKGRSVLCGQTDHLHFDHDIPWSKGGASITAANVRLLCARHNLQKHDNIE
ncbi:MAG: HNH endonuclease [Acidobacteria bacterium]|nr:HNH endonuclease [Acidobacteriota bacterium]